MEKILEKLSVRTTENMTANESDFVNDEGLLCCGICRTPKQTRVCVPQLMIDKIVGCECQCQIDEDKRLEAIMENQRKIGIIEDLRKKAFPSCNNANAENDMKKWTFENDKGYNPMAIEIARNYVNNFDEFRKKGIGIIFYSGFEDNSVEKDYINGGAGVGKSYASACIANALIDREIPVLMTDFSTIYNTAFGITDKQKYFESLNGYPLLILDDLMAERDTPYMKEIVHTVINYRLNSGLPLVVTTNLTKKQITNPFSVSDQRIFSRLTGCCQMMFVQGEDLRKRKMAELFRG